MSIFAYGRRPAPARVIDEAVLDGIRDIISTVDSKGSPSDLAGNLNITSDAGFVRVRIDSISAQSQSLTRGEVSQLCDTVWGLTVAYGPQEILFAQISGQDERDLLGLFEMSFPWELSGSAVLR